ITLTLCCSLTPPSFATSCRHHPDLHSFPTRRSSDLTLPVLSRAVSTPVPFRTRTTSPRPRTKACADRAGASSCARKNSRSKSIRSEEHTSELQSHLNLVCRLLLGKRNDCADRQNVLQRRGALALGRSEAGALHTGDRVIGAVPVARRVRGRGDRRPGAVGDPTGGP